MKSYFSFFNSNMLWGLIPILFSFYLLPIESEGIFDINTTVTATSRTALVEADGFGESIFRTKRLPNGNLKVRYTYDKPSVPNPLFITYAYEIEKLPSGDFAMDMQAAMPPFSLYIDTNAIQLFYTGNNIILPNQLTNNQEFSDVSGVFLLKRIAKNDTLLTYHVSITNRKFVKKGNITLNGKTYEAYSHTYDFIQKSFLKDNRLLSEAEENVAETYLVGCGLVNQIRSGKVTPINVGDGQVVEQKIISELIKIQ
jgi:hypothetical protein